MQQSSKQETFEINNNVNLDSNKRKIRKRYKQNQKTISS